MPRDYRAHENERRAKAGRERALARNELRQESTPRSSAAGATSFPVKAEDPATRAAVDEFLKNRQVDNGEKAEG